MNEPMIYRSHQMVNVRLMIDRLKDMDIPVLITGETGTGKWMVARDLHYLGRRANFPYASVNCGALSETLIENELFGHRKGSYTDAREDREGFFKTVGKGTLNLDEITMLGQHPQSKLLTVVEQGIFYRVGDTTPIKTEARVVASTNEDPNKLRGDLYHRLSVAVIEVPPLRDRADDIKVLMDYSI